MRTLPAKQPQPILFYSCTERNTMKTLVRSHLNRIFVADDNLDGTMNGIRHIQ